jgi:hypothetical protein
MPGAELDRGLILIGKDAKNRPARCCEEATMQTANLNASDHLPLPWLSRTHAVCRGGRSTRARRAAPSVLLRFAIEIAFVAARCHFGRRSPVGAVLQLAQQRRSRSEGPWRRFGFAMTRGSFEVAVATSGLIQPFEVADVGCAGFGAALNPARPIFVT